MMKNRGGKTLFQGKWLELVEYQFETASGECFAWESIRRAGNRDVVVVVPVLVPSRRYILISQYRPLIEKRVIGFPAGLVENNDPGATALSELLEETGYTGSLVELSPPLSINSALSTDQSYLAIAHVDEYAQANIHPRQRLEISEDITVHIVEPDSVRRFLSEQMQAGCALGSGTWYLLGVGRDHLA